MSDVDVFGRPLAPQVDVEPTPVDGFEDEDELPQLPGSHAILKIADAKDPVPPAQQTVLPSEYERGLQSMPMQRVISGVVALEQGKLRQEWLRLSDQQIQFMRVRVMTQTDAEARHILGHERDVSDPLWDRGCECRHHKQAWIDFNDMTLLNWKKQPAFSAVYQAVLHEPVLFAEVAMQSLGPKAVIAYADLLEPTTRDSVRRMAAKDVIEALELKPTPGVQPGHDGGTGPKSGFLYRMAESRYLRGLPLSETDRKLLREQGVEVTNGQAAGAGAVRSLDGEDVVDVDVVVPRGGDNSEFLPD